MATARFVQRADSVDFCPAGNLPAGEVVRLGSLVGVTKLLVKAGELGAIALTGVFDLDKPLNVTFQAGEQIFWRNGQPDTYGDFPLGIAVLAAESGDHSVRILLNHCVPEDAVSNPGEWQTLD